MSMIKLLLHSFNLQVAEADEVNSNHNIVNVPLKGKHGELFNFLNYQL